MNLILIVSILLRLAAMVWSIVLLVQLRDLRMGFLSIMLGLMALRQTLTLWGTHESWSLLITWQATEFPDLIVSAVALLSIFFLKRMLTERKLANDRITNLNERLFNSQEALLRLEKETFLDLETSLKHIVEADAEHLNISRVSVWLYNQDHTEIVCKCQYQAGEIVDQGEIILSASQYPHYFEALERCRTISAEDAHKDPRTAEFSKDYLTPLEISSMMDVPISLQGKTVGIVCHEHIGPTRVWSVQDEDFAASIADICALSLQVAESKQTEKTLLESNERFSASFTDANIGMALVSLDHSIIEANSAFCNMLGYSKDQITGIFLNDITHPDDVNISRDYHHKLIVGEIDNYHFEKRYLHKQGHDIWALLNVSLVRDEKATPLYTIAQIQDITERKWAEEALNKSENKYRTLFEQSADAILIIEGDKFVDCNPATVKMLGYKNKEELLETHPSQLSPQMQADGRSSFEKANEMMSIAFAQGSHRFEWNHKRQNGEVFPVEVLLTAIPFGERNVLHVVWRDITERKQVEEELLKLSRAVEASSSGVIITDADGNIEYVNPKFTEFTGYTKKEVLGQTTRFLLQSEENPDSIYDDISKSITSKGEWKGEFRSRKKDGSLYWDRASISCVKDAKGKITHFIGIQDDVTHEYELSEQLSYQASHDALTGLINRREFERRAERLFSTIRQNKTEHALCFMDLDQFKVINDTCGHTAGDEMLCQLSQILQKIVRHSDTLARLGGDEFGVLMEHCTLEHAHRVATSLRKAIQDYQFVWEGRRLKVGVSIGLVPITPVTENLTELMKQVDSACHMAKDKGRNRIHTYHEGDQELAQRHGEMQWVARINQALEEDQFCLYAQSIVPLDGSTDKHYELLIRMIDENGEIIPPGAFLPAAERYSLISKLDHWVIKSAFGLLADNPEFLEQINFCSVNLSGQSITENEFLDFIIEQLDESGIPGEKICFEITETAAIINLNLAVKLITTLKGLRCRFALDDFGSGLSSFAYLKNLSVDYLKIDGMFVKDIVDDPIDHAMVKSINEIGQVMGMQTIAEFVENNEIKNKLRKIGVNFVQGYGIDKPQPMAALLGKQNNVTNIKRAKSACSK